MGIGQELDRLELRLYALEKQGMVRASSTTPFSEPGDSDLDAQAVGIQAFLHGAIAASAMQAAAPSLPPGEVVPTFASIFACAPAAPSDGGQATVRAFWWGFHVQISHNDLATVLDSADAVNDLVVMVGGNIPSPAAPWIRLIGPFVSATHDLLRSLDRGRGIYISMSWIAPGVFVPTTV